jgi:hypothetical protein
MPFREEWIPASQTLTIETLAAQGCASYFLHDNIVYVGFMEPDPMPEGQDMLYKAIARHAATPTRFLGSTRVAPLTLARVTLL